MLTFDLSRAFGRVRMRGSTRVDFLHRMSTGDLRGLRAGEGRSTVLTTPIGRMVDHLAVLGFEDSLLALTGGGNQGKVIHWLRKYIFFNDDVQLADESDVLPMFGVFGEGADAWAETLVAGAPHWARYAHAGGLVKAPPLQGAGYYFLGNPSQSPILQSPISDFLSPISAYESLRIEAGQPAFPNEIGEEHIPLEAGLWSAVSFSKGCYIGQEIIARMESRGQIARKLVRLALAGPAGSAAPGSRLLSEAGDVGVLTSVSAVSGRALGYVRTAHAVEEVELRVAQTEVRARVLGLGGDGTASSQPV